MNSLDLSQALVFAICFLLCRKKSCFLFNFIPKDVVDPLECHVCSEKSTKIQMKMS